MTRLRRAGAHDRKEGRRGSIESESAGTKQCATECREDYPVRRLLGCRYFVQGKRSTLDSCGENEPKTLMKGRTNMDVSFTNLS